MVPHMALNHHYWRRVFKRKFCRELCAIVEALETRILPSFSGIEQEAEKASADAWDAFMSAPATGDEDPSEFAEAAENIGIEHFQLLNGIRQGAINLFAAALYHAFEQQFVLFGRRELLTLTEESEGLLPTLRTLRERLATVGIDIEAFGNWDRIEELRLLANVVKHADGPSARELHARRPDLFKAPGLPELGRWNLGKPSVYQPLLGEDVYVNIEDVRRFRDELIKFWDELGQAIAAA